MLFYLHIAYSCFYATMELSSLGEPGPQSQKYALFCPLQKKFADFSSNNTVFVKKEALFFTDLGTLIIYFASTPWES